MTMQRSGSRLLVPLLAGLLLAAACGSDADDAASGPSSTTQDATATTIAAPTTEAMSAEVAITAVDYTFDGIPDSADVGTSFSFTNASEGEVHELVLVRLDDGDERPLDELLALAPAEQEELGTTVGVNVAFPGTEGETVFGELSMDEPGRYIALCAIPQGADPDAYRAAAEASTGGPVEVEGTGPPHLVLGMVKEFTVG